jgi:cobalt-zinc-cadmium efflux system protein
VCVTTNMTNIREKPSTQQTFRLKTVLWLSSFYLAAALITVVLTGSLALLSEAGHMLADVGGFALALFAINYTRKPATTQRTYGFYRMEILASLVNSVVLVLLSAYILYEGFRRIFEPPEIQSPPIIIVAAIGLTVNFIGMRLLRSGDEEEGGQSHAHDGNHKNKQKKELGRGGVEKHEQESLSVKAVYLETLSDAIGAAGVIIAGIVMLTTKFYLADPLISIGLALFMLPRAWSIIKKAIHILMEGSPSNISHEEIKEAILQIKGVTGVFELHIWSITSGMHALSAHVVIIDTNKSQTILQEINSTLEKKFGIAHATIQIEKYHSEAGRF